MAVAEQVIGLHQGVDLRGSLVDDRALAVAQVTLDRVLVAVAIRAVDLDRVERALHGVVRAEPLGKAGFARAALAGVLLPAGLEDEQPPGFDAGVHVGEHLLNQLVPADLLAERLPLVGVLERCVQARLRQPHRAGGHGVAPLVDRAHGDRETLALLADPVGHRHLAVREGEDAGVAGPHPELAVQRIGREAGEAALDDERGDSLVAEAPVNRGEDQEGVGGIGQADPDLAAVEEVSVAVAARGGREVGGIAADAGLGQPKGGQLLTARLWDQVALFLFLVRPLQQGQRVQPGVHREDHAEGRVGALHLLAQQREGDVVHPGPPVALGDRQAQQAGRSHLPVQGSVVGRGRVELADARQDLAFGEEARGALHVALRIGQGEVDHAVRILAVRHPPHGGPARILTGTVRLGLTGQPCSTSLCPEPFRRPRRPFLRTWETPWTSAS